MIDHLNSAQPHPLDRFARLAVDHFARKGPPPFHQALTPLRQAAMAAALTPRRHRAEAIARRIQASDPGAQTELSSLAAEALSAMHDQLRARSRGVGPLTRLLLRGDELWRRCETGELLDDPDLDLEMRTSIMTTLDSFNETVASYDRFLAAMLPFAHPARPTRVLDLAAGHGGFAIAAARSARRQGHDLRFTASDIKREYLELGEVIARRESLPVDFLVQDAFDLSNLEIGSFDIIVCTQSLHHFPPGAVAVMFQAATRAAGRGVVFTDGCRSFLAGAGAVLYGTIRARNPAWVHDAWVSTRRCYVPEELELLARLADPDGEIEARWIGPGHCLLRRSKLDRAELAGN